MDRALNLPARWPAFVAVFTLACGGRSNLDVSPPDADAPEVEAGVGVASVTPSVVDFGLVPCGSAAQAKTVTVANSGTAAFSFTATLGFGKISPYSISPAMDVVAPGGFVEVVIWPSPIPAISDTKENLWKDTLTIQTTAPGDSPHVIPIHETARGAVLTWSDLDFGKQLVGSPATLAFPITNDGNDAVMVTLQGWPPFMPTSSTLVVGPKSTASATIAYTPDATKLGQVVSTWLSLSMDGVLCALTPPAPSVSGTAIENAKTIGGTIGATKCALGQTGNLYCWGQNNGAFGNGTTAPGLTPVLSLATSAQSIGGSWANVCDARTGGSVQCWGNDPGVIGNGLYNTSTTALDVTGITDAKRIVGGDPSAVCALRQTGQLACWGYNTYGQFGAGMTSSMLLSPISAFNGINDIVDAFMGPTAGCVVRSGGGVQCAGYQNGGALGNGVISPTVAYSPVNVVGISTAIAVSGAGFYGACALLSSGDVECWGLNTVGSLGNGTNTDSSTPVPVSNLHDAIAISGSYGYMCALRNTGGVVCWGSNSYGMLGNGTTTSSNVPVSVSGITTATAISAADGSACAILADGSVWCWGDGLSGELGTGSYMSSLVPVPVVGFH